MLRAGSTGAIPYPLSPPLTHEPLPPLSPMPRAASMVTGSGGLGTLSAADLGLADLDLNLP